jgi:hypothetical protein
MAQVTASSPPEESAEVDEEFDAPDSLGCYKQPDFDSIYRMDDADEDCAQ